MAFLKNSGRNRVTYPTGHVIYHTSTEVAAATGTSITSDNWYADWISLVVSADDIAPLKKIVVQAFGGCRVDINTHAIADFKIVRIASSDASFQQHTVGAASSNTPSENYNNIGLMGVEDLTTGPTGQRTYQVQVRKTNGTTAYAGAMYYKFSGWWMQATGYA